MHEPLSSCVAPDRRRAFAADIGLPAHASGAAVFADISGFTPLTEAFAWRLGERGSAEVVAAQINRVYVALIAEVERWGGSVIGFAGDSITCWFDDADAPAAPRAAAAALAMQAAMASVAAIALPSGASTSLSIKVAIASGPTRRLAVGSPTIQGLFDVDPVLPLRKQLRQLEATIADLVPDRVQAFPLLGPLLDVAIAENDFTRMLEPQFRQSALHALLLDSLCAAAHEAQQDGGGLLLVLEDLHWIDPTSHDLLEQIACAISELPVLIVLAYRPPQQQRLQAPRVWSCRSRSWRICSSILSPRRCPTLACRWRRARGCTSDLRPTWRAWVRRWSSRSSICWLTTTRAATICRRSLNTCGGLATRRRSATPAPRPTTTIAERWS